MLTFATRRVVLSAALGLGVGVAAVAEGVISHPAQAQSMAVTIKNFSFQPTPLTISVGTTVTWTNKDSAAHTVTSDTGAFDSGNLPSGATYSFTFNQAGTFAYNCNYHSNMHGMIVVQAASATPLINRVAPTVMPAPAASLGACRCWFSFRLR